MAGEVNLPPEAVALLLDVADWADRTGRTHGDLGAMVLNHPGFVPLLKKRGTLRAETEDRLRSFMAEFPDAMVLPDEAVRFLKREAAAGSPWSASRAASFAERMGIKSPPAPREKPFIRAEVIRAAKMDGRDLPTFVTDLIDMGLECWREDRAANGEVVA